MVPIRSESGPEVPARSPVASYVLAGLVVLLSLLFFRPLDAHLERVVQRVTASDDALASLQAVRDGTLHVPFSRGLDLFVLQHGVHFRPTQLVGVAFVHADVWHLLGNVILLLIFGGPVCRAIGGWRFVALWVGCAVVASLGWLLVGEAGYAVGASGVVMGLGVACLVTLPGTRVWVLCHPLSWLGGAVFVVATALLGPTWALALLALVVIAWVVVNLRAWGAEREGPPEGVLPRVLGFVVFRPRVAWLMALLLACDVLGFVVSHGDGPLARILRLAGDNVAHEAHLAGALGGLLGGWFLLSANAVERVAVATVVPPTRRYHRLPAWVLAAPAKVDDFDGWRAEREGSVRLRRPDALRPVVRVGTRTVRRPPPPPLPARPARDLLQEVAREAASDLVDEAVCEAAVGLLEAAVDLLPDAPV